MGNRKVETIIPINADRSLPSAALAQLAKAIHASGVVDYVHVWDQLVGWWPPHLWCPENAPLAAMIPDPDSSGDPQAVAAYAAASAPGLGLTISADAIRRGPAELMQTMLTLANMGSGRAILQLGAGEAKQTTPFGWKRAEGLKRLEDHLRFSKAYWEHDGPFNLEGNFWSFNDAWIGSVRPHRPRIWALGGGPKLIEMGAAYADGFGTLVPGGISSPDAFAKSVREVLGAVEANGRNPAEFDFCPWFPVLIHDDPAVIERAFDNPLIRWVAAFMGRLNQAEWGNYGMESPFPADWHYAMKLIPQAMTDRAYVEKILGRVTRKMTEMTFFYGSAKEIAAQIQPYIDAGATHVDVVDMLPMVLDLSDAQASLGRQLEVCAEIKRNN